MATTKLIPSKFTLAGTNWTVRQVEGISELGLCNPETHTISLRNGMTTQALEQTFCHELVHALMFTAGHINHDEVFVDCMGSLLHQWLKTKE